MSPGTLALDKEFNVVHVGDAAKQTEFVLEQIKAVIEAAGGTMADVTFNHIFLTDWANYGAGQRRLRQVLPGRQAGALLHPVRPGEARRPRRDRLGRPHRQEVTFYDVHESGRPGAPTVLLSSGLGGTAGYWRRSSPRSRRTAASSPMIRPAPAATNATCRTITASARWATKSSPC
jgi:hypothetical protein